MSVDYCDRCGVALSSLLDTYGMESGEYHIDSLRLRRSIQFTTINFSHPITREEGV